MLPREDSQSISQLDSSMEKGVGRQNSEWNRLQKGRSEQIITIGDCEVQSVDKFLDDLLLPRDFKDFVKNRKRDIGHDIYIFEIELKDTKEKKRKYKIRRRILDFKELKDKLVKEEKKGIITKWNLPNFPHDSDLRDPDENLKLLKIYLTELSKCDSLRMESIAFYDFIEYSMIPVSEGSTCYKQGFLKKRTGGRYKENICQVYCGTICRRWLNRWVLLTDDGIVYTVNSQSTKIREMLLFDQSFQFLTGRKDTGTKVGITLITPTRKLALKANNLFEAIDWVDAISKVVANSPYTSVNRFFSYAPVRKENDLSQCKWYITAEHYFPDVCAAIENAQHEIFITDWWLSPELHLVRPVEDIEDGKRLDLLLQQKAKQNVKVYIIVYQEVRLALYNDSLHTKKHLESLDKNIQVIRHPTEMLFLWSHHEKMLVVDQRVGFMGGLDLCYGRYDTMEHPLNDPEGEKGEGKETFPGIDFSNSRIKDFLDVKNNYDRSLIDKVSVPRMPWEDIAIKISGPIVKDLARHFIQYWNFAKIDLSSQKDDYFLTPHTQQKKKQQQLIQEKQKNYLDDGLLPRKKTFKDRVLSALHLKKHNTDEVNGNESLYTKLLDNNNDSDKRGEERLTRYLTMVKEKSSENEKFEMNFGSGGNAQQGGSQNQSEAGTYQPPKLPKQVNEATPQEEDEEEKQASPDPNIKKGIPSEPDANSTLMNKKTVNPSEVTFDGVHSPKSGNKKKSVTLEQDGVQKRSSSKNLRKQDSKGRSATIYNDVAENKEEEKEDIANLLAHVRPKAHTKVGNFYEPKNKEDQEEKEKIQKSLSRKKTGFFFRSNSQHPTEKKIDDNFFATDMLKLNMGSGYDVSVTFKQIATCQCQMLRSASQWSLGLNEDENILENSIQNAYIELIQSSKRYIYIENQFFISSLAGEPVTNGVARAILLRILRAVQKREQFKVYILIPLLPGFEGEIDDAKSGVLRIQVYWEMMTISRGSNSLIGQLLKKNIDPKKYIQFLSLRQHAKMAGVPVTEMIYIHSKLMIIDDKSVLMGSANINDRSLQGTRDSELAIVVQDNKEVITKMNGHETKVSEFAYTLRSRLFQKHFGMTEEEAKDPISEETFRKIQERTKHNTEVYRKVFACYPDDNIKKLTDVKEFKKKANLDLYDELSKEIVGHAVEFPLYFLEYENLKLRISEKEYYVPDINFT